MAEKKWIASMGKPGRVVAARIERGQDTINSIIELIKEYGFKSGTVIGIGSLNSATVIWGRTTDLTRPLEEIIVTCTMEGPVDLGIGWGMFGTEDDGNVFLHFHANIMDKDGNMRCGNLQPGSAPVMATLDITIQELLDMEIKPTLDPVLNHKLLNPTDAT
jgi:predicted DNA-binding protein with PD1-like motif